MVEREIDGCRVELILERAVVRWEEDLKGCCRFHGGSAPVQFTYVELRLQLPSVEGQVAALDRAPVIWQNPEIGPGAVVDRPFSLRIPPRSGLGTTASVVAILMHTRSWIPATLVAPVTLVPARCFTDVLELAARLTGLQPEDWQVGALGDGVRIRLIPNPELPRRVDSIQLEMQRANGFIYGHLVIDPVNVGLVGALKNLTSADLIRLPIRFSEGDGEAVAQQLTQFLRPYVDERGRLPIPSALAPQADILPIPAAARSQSTDALPRPAFDVGHEEEAK